MPKKKAHHGRAASYPTAPVQIPACGTTTRGSSKFYQVFQKHLESYLAQARCEDPVDEVVPAYVEREFGRLPPL